MEHGNVGPRGAYSAANEADLARHLAAELRKAMDAKNEAPRDTDGNLYLPVDYFVVWQAAELLTRLSMTGQQADEGIPKGV